MGKVGEKELTSNKPNMNKPFFFKLLTDSNGEFK